MPGLASSAPVVPTSPHVSHASPGPRSVEILRRTDGQDEALHIKDKLGATLLAL
jgi:hypothetical protein